MFHSTLFFENPFSKPSKTEISLNKRFEEYLDSVEPLATSDEVKARQNVLNEIQKIVNKWIQEVSVRQGFTQDALKAACGKVFTFGSFRLGLITPSSDIDTLCVAPKHISRDDFFGTLLPILEANDHVSELSGVPDAVVPIIKMKYQGIEVDLTFARLNLPIIDSKLENLENNNLLRHLDEKTVRSINGTRVADALLSLVPKQNTYITVLRFIRHWAKKRGLYSNAMGFFGGITWAILSARVCQMYPNFTPLQICSKFFLVFSRWNWSNPVTLCPITHSNEVGLMGFKIWNPKLHASDRYHLMPIITPSFPCMNSTYNVTETTKRILTSEFARGHEVLSSFSEGHGSEDNLNKLIRSPPFLSLFNYYMVVDVVGMNESAFTKLKGFVESRIRMFLKSLEGCSGIQSVRPWPKEFDTSSGPNKYQTSWLIGLSFPPVKAGVVTVADLRHSIALFHEKLNDWSEKEKFVDGRDYSVRLCHLGRTCDLLKGIIQSNPNLFNEQVSIHLEEAGKEAVNGMALGDVKQAGVSWGQAMGLGEDLSQVKRRKLDLEVRIGDI
jgi:poly(A) polymerase